MPTATAGRPPSWKYAPVSLEGKRAIVTGGTTGSGRSITLLLASLGARVVFFGRHRHLLDEAMADLEDVKDHVYGLTADAAREADVDVVFAAADEKYGGLDILINNAGLPIDSIDDATPDEYRYVVETNLLGYMACAKRALPRMREAGGGRIVNIGSISAEKTGPNSDVYSATKAGLRGFSDALAQRAQRDNIHVCLIEPGTFGADFRDESPSTERKKHGEGKLLYSEAVAEAVHFVLTTPPDCHIPFLQVQPIHQS